MKERIACLIIDPNKDSHDYSSVRYDDFINNTEKNFDLKVILNTNNILSDINSIRTFDCIITIGNNIDFAPLNALSFEFRKKWIHMPEFNPILIGLNIINVFRNNINRKRNNGEKLFSIFTCTFNTPFNTIERLYKSLKSQTYNNWNWFILDDSNKFSVSEYIEAFKDPRITIIKNYTNHGVIGFNKHLIAMACDGDYLVEVDHDDELTPDCLSLLNNAFEEFPDASFCYSDTLELMNGIPIYYGEDFSFGQGIYRIENVMGKNYKIAITTPSINPKSVRGIYSLPNHVRCWEKRFYHSIGGHNIELSVLDDMDILIRTFLNGKIIHIPKVLYIQHEDGNNDGNNDRSDTAQGHRFAEIQRTNWILYNKYDKEIHDRIISLGFNDTIWDEQKKYSILSLKNIELPKMNYEYKIRHED